MKSSLKKELFDYFDAPAPKRKRDFLKKHGIDSISIYGVILNQIHYISKSVWSFSAIFFILSLFVSIYAEAKYIWIIFSIIPFFVVISITESMHSFRYGMNELEMVTRFSLKSIIYARMFILGTFNIFLLFIIAGFMGSAVFANILYMLVPYLVTASSGFMIVRKFRGTEGNYMCFGVSVIVGCAEGGLYGFDSGVLFELRYINLWIIAFVVFLFLTAREGYLAVRTVQEL